MHIYINRARGLRDVFFNLFFCCCREEKGHSKHKGGKRGGCREEPHVTRGQDAFKGQRSVGIYGLRPEVDSSSSRPIETSVGGLKRGEEAATGEGRGHARAADRTARRSRAGFGSRIDRVAGRILVKRPFASSTRCRSDRFAASHRVGGSANIRHV